MLLTIIIFYIVKNELTSLANTVITSFGFANFNTFPKSNKFKPNLVFLSHLYSSKLSSFILNDTSDACALSIAWRDNPFEFASKFTSLTKEIKESFITSLNLTWKFSH